MGEEEVREEVKAYLGVAVDGILEAGVGWWGAEGLVQLVYEKWMAMLLSLEGAGDWIPYSAMSPVTGETMAVLRGSNLPDLEGTSEKEDLQ